MFRRLLLACLLFFITGCGKQSVINQQKTDDSAMALGNDVGITMIMSSPAQIGQPFNITFTVHPATNIHNTTLKLTIPATVTVISGQLIQSNLQLTGGQDYNIPLTLRVDNLPSPIKVGFNAIGLDDSNSSAQGGIGFYFINQNSSIVTATHLPYDPESLPEGVLVPTMTANPYPAPTSVSLPKP